MSAPSETHLKAAKIILRYVEGIMNFGIHYLINNHVKTMGYSDSDWGNNIDDEKSTYTNYFSLSSGLVTWSSRK